jgi:hypothetical protein
MLLGYTVKILKTVNVQRTTRCLNELNDICTRYTASTWNNLFVDTVRDSLAGLLAGLLIDMTVVTNENGHLRYYMCPEACARDIMANFEAYCLEINRRLYPHRPNVQRAVGISVGGFFLLQDLERHTK